MPTITINGRSCEFTPGQTILQVANAHGIEIPQYCYHDGLSIPAQCRICLVEAWAPNPRNENTLEPFMGGKLLPSCSTPASDGMVVHADSPKAVANQKAVMEYLLINHPLDCPVCDQAGECFLQDYSYKYGRGVSRFEEQKVKQAKKDLGPHVYIYADRCIMCTRCVRFTREVSGTNELMIAGRGNKSEIDVFPGRALDNDLASNVIDLCPVGALLDKDFLFAQRVWFLKSTPSIDPLTASGDNILIEHNQGRIYRLKPRVNMDVNRWWITDEVRYGWKFVHSENRLVRPLAKRYGTLDEVEWARAYDAAVEGMRRAVAEGTRLAVSISPMLSCEEAFLLARAARMIDAEALLAVGPVPVRGEDRHYPRGIDPADPKAFTVYAEKAPNARGVRRVLTAFNGGRAPMEHDDLLAALGHGSGSSRVGAVLLTGNYPSNWTDDRLVRALAGKFVVLVDTLPTRHLEAADVVLPASTWAEKAGCFENAKGLIQGFEQAIPVTEGTRPEGQIALDLEAVLEGGEPVTAAAVVRVVDEQPGQVPAATTIALTAATPYNAAQVRQAMAAAYASLGAFTTEVRLPSLPTKQEPDVAVVEL